MKKLNTDMILGYCCNHGSTFLYKFYRYIGGAILSEKILVDKRLLNINEFCSYLGIKQTKARELMTKTNNPYTVRLGNRLYANKVLLDKWIDSISGNKISD
jgi:predicted DNA-binding transcriptional regulator AlpA